MKKYYILFLLSLIVNSISAQKLPKLIPVEKNNKWGFTNRKLLFVIKPVYDDVIFPFTAYQIPNTKNIDTLAYVKVGEERFFINKKGIRLDLPKSFTHNDRYDNPQATMTILDKSEELAMKKKIESDFVTDPVTNKIGIKDQLTDSILVKPQYDKIKKIYPGDNPNSELFAVQSNGKYGVINSLGKIILNIEYDFIEGLQYFDGKDSFCFSVVKDRKRCMVNEKNIMLINPEEYVRKSSTNIQNLQLYYSKKDQLNYLYDFAKQEFINKIGYNDIDPADYPVRLLKAKRGSKIFYIDEKGTEFIAK